MEQESGVPDYLGAFCNASFGLEPIVAQYKADGDDYSYIMAEALADRYTLPWSQTRTCFSTHIHTRAHPHARMHAQWGRSCGANPSLKPYG